MESLSNYLKIYYVLLYYIKYRGRLDIWRHQHLDSLKRLSSTEWKIIWKWEFFSSLIVSFYWRLKWPSSKRTVLGRKGWPTTLTYDPLLWLKISSAIGLTFRHKNTQLSSLSVVKFEPILRNRTNSKGQVWTWWSFVKVDGPNLKFKRLDDLAAHFDGCFVV